MASAGDRPTAAEWNNMLPRRVVKSGDESRTSTTAIADDSELFLSVAANTFYHVQAFLIYDGATAGDLRIGWSAPASTTFQWVGGGLDSASAGLAGTMYVGHWSIASEHVYGAAGSGTNAVATPMGMLATAGTAGTFRLRFAQGTSSATSTRIRANSYLCLWVTQ